MKPANPIVMLGLDVQRKPHAARFDAAQIDVVRKAAALMGMRLGWPKTEEAAQLVAKLPVGKLFAAGRGLVPLVKSDLHKQLMEKLELEPEKLPAPTSAAGKLGEQPSQASGKAPAAAKAEGGSAKSDIPQQAAAKAAPTMLPAPPADPWAAIKVGNTVIAREQNPDDGWWRATVVAISKDGARLTLRWLDAPKQPPVTLKRHAVALLYPS